MFPFGDWYPPVGVFIAILAVLGVLVPLLREHIGRREKAVWTIVMFLLVGLEIRSIYLDRAAHDRQETQDRETQLTNFREIAKGIDTTIATSQKQFEATMKSTNLIIAANSKLLGVTEESLKNITGSDSVPYIVPEPQVGSVVPLVIRNQGRHILSGVTVEIRKADDFSFVEPQIDIGTLYPGGMGKPLTVALSPAPDASGTAGYEMRISTQSYLFLEIMWFRRNRTPNNYWASRFVVYKVVFKGRSSTTYPVINRPWSDDAVAKAKP